MTRLNRQIKTTILLAILAVAQTGPFSLAGEPDGWAETVERNAPKQPTVKRDAPRELLVFSLATGYQHRSAINICRLNFNDAGK